MSCDVIVLITLRDRQQCKDVVFSAESLGDLEWGDFAGVASVPRTCCRPPQTQLFHLTGVEGGRSGKARPNCWVSLSSSREHGAGNSSNSRLVGSLQSLTAERGKEAGGERAASSPSFYFFFPLSLQVKNSKFEGFRRTDG